MTKPDWFLIEIPKKISERWWRSWRGRSGGETLSTHTDHRHKHLWSEKGQDHLKYYGDFKKISEKNPIQHFTSLFDSATCLKSYLARESQLQKEEEKGSINAFRWEREEWEEIQTIAVMFWGAEN